MGERAVLTDPARKIWDFFSSVKLTVVLLLSLAATSIIGTLIPQNRSLPVYLQEYGGFLFKTFSFFDLFDMYHSWWFQFLILLLTINVVICSLNRFSATWKIVLVKNPAFKVKRFRSIQDKVEFADVRSPEQLQKIYEPAIQKRFGYSRTEKTDKGFCIFAEKWRWTRFGVYTVHFSVVLLLTGGLIGSIFGFEGSVNIPEGKSINSIHLKNSMQSEKLNFTIRCDKFKVSFYESGMPKEYRSSLVVLENEKPVLKKDIIVNSPLRYKGISVFQASYGMLAPKKLDLNIRSVKTDKIYHKKTRIGEPFNIPENNGRFMIKDYIPSFDFRGHDIGEVFVGIYTPENGKDENIILPLRFPSFDRMRRGAFIFSVENYTPNYYTGLQVTKDPGVWVVYSGFIMMIIGFYITFFMSHQRICVEVFQKGKKSNVMVAGRANKNKLGMRNKMQKLAGILAGRDIPIANEHK